MGSSHATSASGLATTVLGLDSKGAPYSACDCHSLGMRFATEAVK